MTFEEIRGGKPYLEACDIEKYMGCGRNKAYEYILIIKQVSDVGKTAGRVMVRDFIEWAYGNIKKEPLAVPGSSAND